MEPNNSNKLDRRRGPRHDNLVVTQHDEGTTTYRGRAENALDEKGRLTLPRQYLDMLQKNGEDSVVLVPYDDGNDRYVLLMRRGEFEAFKARLAKLTGEKAPLSTLEPSE